MIFTGPLEGTTNILLKSCNFAFHSITDSEIVTEVNLELISYNHMVSLVIWSMSSNIISEVKTLQEEFAQFPGFGRQPHTLKLAQLQSRQCTMQVIYPQMQL